MDPVTHAALGITAAIAVAPKSVRLRDCVLVGALAGCLPDADVLLSSPHDPLFAIEYHRHFSHSLLFSPVIASLATLATRLRHPLSNFLPRLATAWAAALSHLAADAWTSYGTHIAWPFSASRLSLDLIAVVDPLVTLPLAALAVAAIRRKSRVPAVAGLAWVGLYLAAALFQQHRARTAHQLWLARQNLPTATRTTVKPSFGNILVWRALSDHGSVIQAAAIRCGLGPAQVLAGDRHPFFSSADDAIADFQLPPDSTQARDLHRFHRLSDGWTGRHPQFPDLVGDLRYATLPHTIAPLWAIRPDPENPSAHVAWAPRRSLRTAPWPELRQLLHGRAFDTNDTPSPGAPKSPLEPDGSRAKNH